MVFAHEKWQRDEQLYGELIISSNMSAKSNIYAFVKK